MVEFGEVQPLSDRGRALTIGVILFGVSTVDHIRLHGGGTVIQSASSV